MVPAPDTNTMPSKAVWHGQGSDLHRIVRDISSVEKLNSELRKICSGNLALSKKKSHCQNNNLENNSVMRFLLQFLRAYAAVIQLIELTNLFHISLLQDDVFVGGQLLSWSTVGITAERKNSIYASLTSQVGHNTYKFW